MAAERCVDKTKENKKPKLKSNGRKKAREIKGPVNWRNIKKTSQTKTKNEKQINFTFILPKHIHFLMWLLSWANRHHESVSEGLK